MDGWVSDDEQCNVKLCFERLQVNPGQQGLPADKHFGGCRQATPCMDLAEHPLLADDDEALCPSSHVPKNSRLMPGPFIINTAILAPMN